MSSIAGLLLLAACARTSVNAGGVPTWKDTIYQFNEKPPGTDRVIQGTLRVLGDTALVEAQPGPCRYVPGRGPAYLTYQCDDAQISVDLSDAQPRATYRTTKTVVEYKSVCTRYETNALGQRICAATNRDRVETKVGISGNLPLTAQP